MSNVDPVVWSWFKSMGKAARTNPGRSDKKPALSLEASRCAIASMLTRVCVGLKLPALFGRFRALVLGLAWYLPAAFVTAIGIVGFFSPHAALWVLLIGCVTFASGLFVLARLIRQRYHALLARMPKINGQVPKRLEFHAVVVGVGEQPANPPILNGDDYEQEPELDLQEDLKAAANGSTGSPGEKLGNEKIESDADVLDDDELDEDTSSFEIYEVPILRRDRIRKTIIH